jgi:hypothetical protein
MPYLRRGRKMETDDISLLRKDKIVHAIQEMLHSSLSHAMSKLPRDDNKIKALEVLPIALSRFVYRELLLLSHIDKAPVEQLNKLFAALLNDLVANKIDMFKLHVNQKEGIN